VKKACGLLLLCATTGVALPAQTFTTLHSFDGPDGNYLEAPLVQATNGMFYGTTPEGGANLNSSPPYYGCGTVFSLSVGLGAFVETQPTTGRVGAAVKTLRTNLNGTTQHHL
jgi:hypothetical protein